MLPKESIFSRIDRAFWSDCKHCQKYRAGAAIVTVIFGVINLLVLAMLVMHIA